MLPAGLSIQVTYHGGESAQQIVGLYRLNGALKILHILCRRALRLRRRSGYVVDRLLELLCLIDGLASFNNNGSYLTVGIHAFRVWLLASAGVGATARIPHLKKKLPSSWPVVKKSLESR